MGAYKDKMIRELDYSDIDRFFNYTKKYITFDFYSKLKNLHPINDIDKITGVIWDFFDKVSSKPDLDFLQNFNESQTWTDNDSRKFRQLVLDNMIQFDKEYQRLKERAKMLKTEGLTPEEVKQLPVAETLKPEIGRRVKYTKKEILFIKNRVKKNKPTKQIIKEYNKFSIRNHLPMRTKTGLSSKIYRIRKNEN
jgi:hypothetical protein